MTSHTTEQAFESTVESMLLEAGWRAGDRGEWDIDRALFPARAVAFIRDTQPDEWARMAGLHGDDIESLIVAQLARELDTKGALDVLRHGFRFSGRTFRLAYFAPAHGLNPDARARFERNELTVTRQAPCHPRKGDTLDLVFALNGVPVATCELKNPMTGQTWRDAVRQYEQDRDPNAPLFRFKRRALVHFAADPDEVHMTTRLAGAGTRFLPFNRGSNPGAVHCGAGNPANPDGYRTDYFWREVLERERFLDILGSYVFLETREEKVEDAKGARTEKRETMIFPRYHQLDSVHGLVEAARADGPGRNYLIQHSAGSGKTNSISWLSHRLASLHTAADEKVFDCVVVITDRRVLDRQLQDAIYQIEHAQGVVQAIDENSQQLAASARRRHEDRHHHDPEVPVRHEWPAARRRSGCARGGSTRHLLDWPRSLRNASPQDGCGRAEISCGLIGSVLLSASSPALRGQSWGRQFPVLLDASDPASRYAAVSASSSSPVISAAKPCPTSPGTTACSIRESAPGALFSITLRQSVR